MKKVLTILMVVLMLASISVSALAAPNGFVSSPSGNAAPTVEEFKPYYDAEFEAAVKKSVLTSKVMSLIRNSANIIEK